VSEPPAVSHEPAGRVGREPERLGHLRDREAVPVVQKVRDPRALLAIC